MRLGWNAQGLHNLLGLVRTVSGSRIEGPLLKTRCSRYAGSRVIWKHSITTRTCFRFWCWGPVGAYSLVLLLIQAYIAWDVFPQPSTLRLKLATACTLPLGFRASRYKKPSTIHPAPCEPKKHHVIPTPPPKQKKQTAP